MNEVQAGLALIFGSGGLIAVGYLLWKVQHSLIEPMDKRISTLEKSDKFQRQEREVCEWRLQRIMMWLREQKQLTPTTIDLEHDRPVWAKLSDPIEVGDPS